MSVQVENLEKSMAKLTIEVSAEQFEAAMQKAYIKNKGRIQRPGFRKGKAPRAMRTRQMRLFRRLTKRQQRRVV